MIYVIQRDDDGKYVAPLGSDHSYTAKLQNARVFDTRESAHCECCGNERVLSIYQAMGLQAS